VTLLTLLDLPNFAGTGVRHVEDGCASVPAPRVGEVEPPTPSVVPSLADVVTLTSYGLGLWWAIGGPTWAGVASIVGDEVDGRLARATGTTSLRGGALDWGMDVALTPLSLWRLGRETKHVGACLAAAPAVLYVQADLKGRGWRPPILSARALVMIAAMFAHERQK